LTLSLTLGSYLLKFAICFSDGDWIVEFNVEIELAFETAATAAAAAVAASAEYELATEAVADNIFCSFKHKL
jgi:hypothetical protein